jgi:prepilin-type N-terminal cleavage/methylation domain-containing protein
MRNRIKPTHSIFIERPPLRKGGLSNSFGFTLIELMVVMAIIVVVTVVGMVSYTGASMKARDARRMADLEKVSLALEMYRADKKAYPADLTSGDFIGDDNYLKKWPDDPKKDDYKYIYVRGVGTSYKYTISAYVENVGSSNMAPVGECGQGSKSKTCNYKINNP